MEILLASELRYLTVLSTRFFYLTFFNLFIESYHDALMRSIGLPVESELRYITVLFIQVLT